MKAVVLIQKYMAVIILIVACVSLFVPCSFNWVKPSSITILLGIVMLGMGIAMKPSDFKIVFTHPKNVLIGCLAQFLVMPGLAWLLTVIFNLPQDIAIGVILVGCCPGGTASNLITYLAKGDLALSVGMTTVSTILAPILTPLLCLLLAGTHIDVAFMPMFLSILQVVIVPILIGFIIQRFFHSFAEKFAQVLPAISTIAIALIVGSVVSANSEKLFNVGLVILLIVILHNVGGYLIGFLVGYVLKLPFDKRSAISIEVGMQNSGLACGLAQQHFANLALATIPGAVFCVWHNISGAILAKIYSVHADKIGQKDEQLQQNE